MTIETNNTNPNKTAKTRRRWFRFRLRTLLVMVTVLSVPLGWAVWELDQRRGEKVVVAWVEETGGGVHFYSDLSHSIQKKGFFSDERSWWEKKKDNWFGERVWFMRLEDLSDTQVNDLISPLAGLKNLKWLQLESTQVSDLSPLAELKNLQWLILRNTQVNDLSPLADLKKLQSLELYNTQVSDLSPLAELKNLKRLALLGNTQVSDLSPLEELKKLETLFLLGVQASDEQVQELWQALPNCEISF